jgi:hypothetical protein
MYTVGELGRGQSGESGNGWNDGGDFLRSQEPGVRSQESGARSFLLKFSFQIPDSKFEIRDS